MKGCDITHLSLAPHCDKLCDCTKPHAVA